jgi:hypothetical protein
MSYRPITDVWILARPKLSEGAKYYGSYPAGFLSRARALLGVSMERPVLHVCAGLVRNYPFSGLGRNDRTVDLDPATHPRLHHGCAHRIAVVHRRLAGDPRGSPIHRRRCRSLPCRTPGASEIGRAAQALSRQRACRRQGRAVALRMASAADIWTLRCADRGLCRLR